PQDAPVVENAQLRVFVTVTADVGADVTVVGPVRHRDCRAPAVERQAHRFLMGAAAPAQPALEPDVRRRQLDTELEAAPGGEIGAAGGIEAPGAGEGV